LVAVAVGGSVGAAVGTAVGTDVGAAVGAAAGTVAVGGRVEAVVGTAVGAAAGTAGVGGTVGGKVGTTVGEVAGVHPPNNNVRAITLGPKRQCRAFRIACSRFLTSPDCRFSFTRRCIRERAVPERSALGGMVTLAQERSYRRQRN
jgi:hypothetical protein